MFVANVIFWLIWALPVKLLHNIFETCPLCQCVLLHILMYIWLLMHVQALFDAEFGYRSTNMLLTLTILQNTANEQTHVQVGTVKNMIIYFLHQ